MLNLNKFVIVDIETTGNSPKKGDRMIQFAGVVIENNKITDTYTTYINPQIPISPFISELTGIDNKTVAKAPVFSEVAEEILQLLNGACFVAHNVHFDLTFLQDELELSNFPKANCTKLDTVEMTRILMPTLESYKLSDIALHAGFEHDRPHQADSDAIVTAEWFLELIDKTSKLPKQTLYQLRNLAKHVKTDLYDILDKIYSEKNKNQDIIPEQLEEYRGLVLKKQQNQKIVKKQENEEGQEKSKDYLERHLTKLNLTEEENSFVRYNFQALNEGEIALIETEPGYNRELLYTISAVLFSNYKQKPVLIATSTIFAPSCPDLRFVHLQQLTYRVLLRSSLTLLL